MLAAGIRLAAVVPLAAGAGGVLGGAAFLGEAVGTAADSHLRYLSGVLLALGAAALWCSADLPRRRGVFHAICALVVAGGAARALGWAIAGPPPWPHQAALMMELGVVPALWWASRRAAARDG